MAPKQSEQDSSSAPLPGPGQYAAAQADAGAAFSFVRAPRQTAERAADAPAPGAYNVAGGPAGPAWSMPTAGRRMHGEDGEDRPAPGDYNIGVQFCCVRKPAHMLSHCLPSPHVQGSVLALKAGDCRWQRRARPSRFRKRGLLPQAKASTSRAPESTRRLTPPRVDLPSRSHTGLAHHGARPQSWSLAQVSTRQGQGRAAQPSRWRQSSLALMSVQRTARGRLRTMCPARSLAARHTR